jgi:alpha-L-rhamnosidase
MRTLAILLFSALLTHGHTTLDLKVAHQTAPVGVDDATPRFSWRIEGDTKGLAQTAYQILVATSPGLLAAGKADLWDSGEVKSNAAVANYAGKPLPSSTWIHWTVRTWVGEKTSEWSAPQKFLTALIGSQPQQPFISFKDTSPLPHRSQQAPPPARPLLPRYL